MRVTKPRCHGVTQAVWIAGRRYGRLDQISTRMIGFIDLSDDVGKVLDAPEEVAEPTRQQRQRAATRMRSNQNSSQQRGTKSLR